MSSAQSDESGAGDANDYGDYEGTDSGVFNDSEMNLVCHDERLARDVRLRLWTEHLDCPRGELEGDPTEIVDQRWRPSAEAGGTMRLLPHVSRRSKGILGPLNGFLVDG